MMKQHIPAGEFSTWLKQIRNAQKNNTGMDVPCSECTACCNSSFFIHIKPEEKKTISHIPKESLFPAPGLHNGNVLMGYDKSGHCPMFVNSRCSIYEDRPLTCRSFDCRVFPATGVKIGEKHQVLIFEQTHRWKFNFPGELDAQVHSAIKNAAKFIKDNSNSFPANFIPGNSTQLAILILKVYEVFNHTKDQLDKSKIIHEIVEAYKKFENKINA